MVQALRLGVNIHFNQPVRKVKYEHGKVKGIETEKGFISADMVVSDVDIHRFYHTLLPDKKRLTKIQKEERSSSAMIFSWGMKGTFPELDIHNIFFSKSYKEEFEYLFEKKEVFDDPTVYIYISSKFRKEDAPDRCENWFVMINAPADNGQQWEEMIVLARQSILDKLERMLGKELRDSIVCEEVLSPPGIERLTGSVNGSIYGSSSNSRYSSFNRHANFRKDIKGLYFVGGSVHPGEEIQLDLSTANIVSELMKEQMKKRK